MKITYKLDRSEDLDPLDLLGDIEISVSPFEKIKEHDVYIDSWLYAMIEGLSRVKCNEKLAIDISEESYPLVFILKNSLVSIFYKDTTIHVEEIKDAISITTKVIDQFLSEVSPLKDSSKNLLLNEMKELIMKINRF